MRRFTQSRTHLRSVRYPSLLGETTQAPEDRELIEEVEGAVMRDVDDAPAARVQPQAVTAPIVLDLDTAIADTRRRSSVRSTRNTRTRPT